MIVSTRAFAPTSHVGRPFRWVDRQARQAFFGKLARVRAGRIEIVEGNRRVIFGARDTSLEAIVTVHDPRCYGEMALKGSVGAGESYMKGRWSCDDLVALMRISLREEEVFGVLDGPWSRLVSSWRRCWHWLRGNSRGGSRRNIAHHYDLSNEFFATFLDDTMMYSCAKFASPTMSLRDASVAKIDQLCDKLALSPRDHLLEIGSGWGGFALHAAQRYGCRVTTTTISRRQFDLVRQRVASAGLTERVTVLLRDYRELTGLFDKVVSIEMIEAVGRSYWGTYFRKCASLLKPGGRMALQAITIADARSASYYRSVDFIQRYIFPGGCLPSPRALAESSQGGGLRILDQEWMGQHYAQTLHHWRRRFLAQMPNLRKLGCDDFLTRMWEYYFCYCESGFLERNIDLVQMVLAKPK